MSQLQTIVDKFMNEELAGEPESRVLAAVSGGVDSMVLLNLLHSYCERNHHQLMVVHINHGLRRTAFRDEQHVKRVCQEFEIPCFVRQVNVTEVAFAETKGTEADARNLRYEAMYDVAKESRAACIVLAHHADDQVETFLWRWLRGTTATGLGGIRPVSNRRGVRLFRPFLTVRKRDLLAYAEAEGITYCTDETNEDLQYTRNYLRHEVIPKLEQIQPELASVTSRLTTILQDEDVWLQQLVQSFIDSTVTFVDDVYTFSVNEWRRHPIPLQRRAIHILLYCFASVDWSFAHAEAIVQLIATEHPSAQVSLPQDFVAWREYDTLFIGRRRECLARSDAQIYWTLEDGASLSFPGATDAGSAGDENWRFSCSVWRENESVHTASPFKLLIPPYESVLVRVVQTNERMRMLGLNGSKKVQDIFTDRKVPRAHRTKWPGIYVDNQLIWMAGLARSEEGLLQKQAKLGWRITAVPPKPLVTSLSNR